MVPLYHNPACETRIKEKDRFHTRYCCQSGTKKPPPKKGEGLERLGSMIRGQPIPVGLNKVVHQLDDGVRVQFAASVGNPSQDDEYIPYNIIISSNGSMSITKAIDLDTSSKSDE